MVNTHKEIWARGGKRKRRERIGASQGSFRGKVAKRKSCFKLERKDRKPAKRCPEQKKKRCDLRREKSLPGTGQAE